MTFTASYTIKAKDQFTPVAQRIQKEFDKLIKRADMLNKTFGTTVGAMMKLGNVSSSQVKKINELKMALEGVNAQMSSLSKRRMPSFSPSGGGRPYAGGKNGLGGGVRGAAFAAGVPMIGRYFFPAYLGYKGIQSTVEQGTGIENTMAGMKALTGASTEQLKQFEREIFHMGATFGQSSLQVAEGVKVIANANPALLKNTQQLTEFSKAAMLLSAAGGDDLESSAVALTKLTSMFGQPYENANKLVDIIAAGSKYGVVETSQVGQAFTKLGGIPKQLGMTPQQTVALIEAGGKNYLGQPAQESRMLRSILATFAKNKINVGEMGLTGTFEIAARKLNSFKNEADRTAWAIKFFGKEAAPLALDLIEVRGSFAQLEKHINESGNAQMQANARLDTTTAQFTRMKVGLEHFETAIWESSTLMKDTFKWWADTFEQTTNQIQGAPEADKFLKAQGVGGYAAGQDYSFVGKDVPALIDQILKGNMNAAQAERTHNQYVISLTDEAKKLFEVKELPSAVDTGRNMRQNYVTR